MTRCSNCDHLLEGPDCFLGSPDPILCSACFFSIITASVLSHVPMPPNADPVDWILSVTRSVRTLPTPTLLYIYHGVTE